MAELRSRGVSSLAALLQQLATGEPIRTAHFAERGGYARSSIFDLARRLEKEGFLVRDAKGALQAGPVAFDLAWSLHGLAGLRGAAEAVLLWLRDHVEANITLTAGADDLLRVAAPKLQRSGQERVLAANIVDHSGSERMRLTLELAPQADLAAAKDALRRAAATLEHELELLT